MNISKQTIDDLNAVLTLTVEKADYETRVNDALNNYRKKVQMPGFRPGKVPAGMVKKMYGKSILADEINKLVSENLSNYITDNKLNLLGEPLPSEKQQLVDFDANESFEFIFDIATAPEFEADLSKKDKLPYYTIAITDEMIDQQIKSVTGRFGKNEVVDVISDQSMIKASLVELDANGNAKQDGIQVDETVISMMVAKDDAERNKLVGSKVGDAVVMNLAKAYPNANELSYMLKISKEQAEGLTSDFKVTVNEITEFKYAELNQDLFTQLYGEGVVNNEEEFKNKVKEELANNLAFESDYRFQLDAREKLVAKFDIKLPEAFLIRWIKATNHGNDKLTDEQINAEMPKFIEDLKWQLIKNKVIEANKLEIDHQDVLAAAKQAARIQFMQYGLSNIPEDYLENYAMDMLNKEEQRRQFAQGAINTKVLNFIKEAVKLDEKELSRDEFNKLFENN
ncbi:trigger factor [Breznakibacter xylanolyticus]|uniref:Trigger factor n=1 Tax=Breznakibacter xylanolyticus TaxID=990 RepID=A0A2W7NRN0_9BACT|nr:trigger factor [Breznakibacter xylanolyticus]PZX19264.1 trigger factor [Breznakibacter xylanolyticus]